jgi:hypothetical protein
MRRLKRKIMGKLKRRKAMKVYDSNSVNTKKDHPVYDIGTAVHENMPLSTGPSNDEILQELEQWESKVGIETIDAAGLMKPKKKGFSRRFKSNKAISSKGEATYVHKQERTQTNILDLAMARRYTKKSMAILDQAFDSMIEDPMEGEKRTMAAFTYASAAKRLVARSKAVDGDRRDTNYADLIEPIGLSDNDDPEEKINTKNSFLEDMFCDSFDCGNPTLNKTRLLALQTTSMLEELQDGVNGSHNGYCKNQSQMKCLTNDENRFLAEACSALNDRTCQFSDNDYLCQAREEASIISPMYSQMQYPAKSTYSRSGIFQEYTYSRSGIFQVAKEFFQNPVRKSPRSEVTKMPPIEFVRFDSHSTFSSIANHTAATESSSSSSSIEPRRVMPFKIC